MRKFDSSRPWEAAGVAYSATSSAVERVTAMSSSVYHRWGLHLYTIGTSIGQLMMINVLSTISFNFGWSFGCTS